MVFGRKAKPRSTSIPFFNVFRLPYWNAERDSYFRFLLLPKEAAPVPHISIRGCFVIYATLLYG